MPDVLVLCYHAVSPAWPSLLAVTPARLEEQLAWLARRGFRGVTLSEAVTAPPAQRTVAVTFDDAFRSVLDHAAPMLARVGFPATVFPVSDQVGAAAMAWPGIDDWLGGEHEGELRSLTWDELRGLADQGWEVGSHTRTHPYLTSLDDGSLAEELRGSRARIEAELGRPCRSLAYPYGDVDGRVVDAARAAGYTVAGTLPHRLPRASSPLAWPRVGIYRGDSLLAFRAKVSPAVRRLRRSPAWLLFAGASRVLKPLAGRG